MQLRSYVSQICILQTWIHVSCAVFVYHAFRTQQLTCLIMSVVRYTGTPQAIGTRSTPAPLAQRHSDEPYMDTRSEMYEGCTNMAHII